MPRFSVPRYIEFVDELDKTASGKIRKQALRDLGGDGDDVGSEQAGYVITRDGRVTKRET